MRNESIKNQAMLLAALVFSLSAPLRAEDPIQPGPLQPGAIEQGQIEQGSAVSESDEPGLVVSKPGVRIEIEDVDAYMLRIPADKRAGFIDKLSRLDSVLENLVLTRQLAQAARDAGMDRDPLISREMRLAEEDVLAKRYLAREMAKIEQPDFDAVARERYDANPAQYREPTTIDVRHLVIRREGRSDEQAQSLAKQLREQFLQGSVSFEEFVKEHSEESSAKTRAGLIRGLQPGQAVPGFDKAAFALRAPDELSEVVSSKFGYHIIQLLARTESRQKTYEELGASLRQELEGQHRARLREDVLMQFQMQITTINPASLEVLRSRYLPGAEGEIKLRELDGAAASGSPATGETQASGESGQRD